MTMLPLIYRQVCIQKFESLNKANIVSELRNCSSEAEVKRVHLWNTAQSMLPSHCHCSAEFTSFQEVQLCPLLCTGVLQCFAYLSGV
mmetsp:Transcript_2162/g.14235  ORF Transcript_2162/g.14235 Transcript_2162/m.14235 type:complete len:87 (-) Transcript_2162:3063-3323(-)